MSTKNISNKSVNIFDKSFVYLVLLSLLFDVAAMISSNNYMFLCIESILYYFFIFLIIRPYFDLLGCLIILLNLSIPTSFVSCFPVSYETLPISFYSIFNYLALFYVILRKKVNYLYFVPLLFFLSITFFYSFVVSGKFDFLKNIVNIFTFLSSFLIGSVYEYEKPQKGFAFICCKAFILGAVLFAIQVIMQSLLYKMTGNMYGTLAEMPSRLAFAGFMKDYSFASLYLCMGAVFLLILFNKNMIRSRLLVLLLISLLLFAMITTSGRTGILVFFVSCIVISFIRFKKNIIIWLLFLIIITTIFYICVMILLSNRGIDGFLDSNGRNDLIEISLNLIQNSPVLGYGLNIYNVIDYSTLDCAPHNLIVQLLLQTGLVGLLLFACPFLIMIYFNHSKFNYFLFLIVFSLLGGMFIPSVYNSKFFGALIIDVFININIECSTAIKSGCKQ